MADPTFTTHGAFIKWATEGGEQWLEIPLNAVAIWDMLGVTPKHGDEISIVAGPADTRIAAAKLPGSPFEKSIPNLLYAAWLDGWGACRDSEYSGDEATSDRFNNSPTLVLCLNIEHPAQPEKVFTPIRERDDVLTRDGWQYPFESHENPDVSRCYVDGDKAAGVVHIDGTLDAESLERLAAYLRRA